MLGCLAAVFAAASYCAHCWTAYATARARKGIPQSAKGESVSLVIPLCGLEPYSQECIKAALLVFNVSEVIFCVERFSDPIVPLVRKIIASAPEKNARLLIGRDVISANPMLNNLAKGWRASSGEWVALVNSNVLMPRDYIDGMLQEWTYDTGIVCAPPVGIRPRGFAAQIECAFLNTYQARWQYAANAIGLGFAQGKGVLWRKSFLDDNGGVEALGAEMAEDAATTKLIRSVGLRVRLASEPSYQPLGKRSFRDVWNRQVRWARLRRVTFPFEYTAEIATSCLVVAGAAGVAFGWPTALCMAVAWYCVEDMLARARGWPVTPLAALVARDVLLPAVWLAGWLGSGFEWRGNRMNARKF